MSATRGGAPHSPRKTPARKGRAGGYRFSEAFIKRWERRLTWILGGGIAVGVVLVLAALGLGALFDGSVPDEDPKWSAVWGLLIAGAVVGGLGVLVPLFLGCLLGGLALHRFGWLPGLFTYVGILATAAGQGLGANVLGELDGWLTPLGVVLLVVGVLGFFLVGALARAPMSVAGIRVDRSPDREP